MGNAGSIDASKEEEVDLSGKGLKKITFRNLDNARIVKLGLYNNQLTSLPVEIGMLAGLKGLYLDSNQLTSLPVEIGRLTGLTYLELSNNQLTSLQVEIGMLTGLKGLYLSNNQLTSLPAELGNMTGLEVLLLSDNQLTSLPVEIGRLTGLEVLGLDNNPLTTPPMEVCEEGITAICAYFLEHQAHSSPDEENPKAKTTQPAQQEGLVSSHGGLPSYDEAVLLAPDDDAPPSYDQLMMDENSRVGSM